MGRHIRRRFPNTVWTPELDAEIIKANPTQETNYDIAKRLKVSKHALERRRAYLGLPHRFHVKCITTESMIAFNKAQKERRAFEAEDRDRLYVERLTALGGFPAYSEREIKAGGTKRFFAVCLPVIWPLKEAA